MVVEKAGKHNFMLRDCLTMSRPVQEFGERVDALYKDAHYQVDLKTLTRAGEVS